MLNELLEEIKDIISENERLRRENAEFKKEKKDD